MRKIRVTIKSCHLNTFLLNTSTYFVNCTWRSNKMCVFLLNAVKIIFFLIEKFSFEWFLETFRLIKWVIKGKCGCGEVLSASGNAQRHHLPNAANNNNALAMANKGLRKRGWRFTGCCKNIYFACSVKYLAVIVVLI